jgi:hypothetical protein
MLGGGPCHSQRAGSRTRGVHPRATPAAALDRADGDLRHAGVTPARGRRHGEAAQGKRCSSAMARRRRRGRVNSRCRRRSDTRGLTATQRKGRGEVSGGRRRGEGGSTMPYLGGGGEGDGGVRTVDERQLRNGGEASEASVGLSGRQRGRLQTSAVGAVVEVAELMGLSE